MKPPGECSVLPHRALFGIYQVFCSIFLLYYNKRPAVLFLFIPSMFTAKVCCVCVPHIASLSTQQVQCREDEYNIKINLLVVNFIHLLCCGRFSRGTS